MMIAEVDEGRFGAACVRVERALTDVLDDDAVRAEFEAIIATAWPPRRRVFAPPACLLAPGPGVRFRRSPARYAARSDTAPWRAEPDIARRQRSPPRAPVMR